VSPLRIVTLVALLIAVCAAGAHAADPSDLLYYQFRQVSGSPGNGFGVTPSGQVGFDGALQQNIPVAYTPANLSVVGGYWSGSNNSSLQLGFSGANVNGTALLGLGIGSPSHAIYIGHVFTESNLKVGADDVQVLIMPETSQHPAVAIGVVDIFSLRDRVEGSVRKGARSVYVVATKQTGSHEHPIYWTLGWGDGKFDNGPFGGVSWSLAEHLTLCAEHDGLSTNAGLAYGVGGRQGDSSWNGVLYFGYTDLEHPVVGGCVTYRR
jgi:hypothetical protein